MKYLPLSLLLQKNAAKDGKASYNRDESEDLPELSIIQSFREEKHRIIN
jgi:hypothetical protein